MGGGGAARAVLGLVYSVVRVVGRRHGVVAGEL
jgi:hypothetical protein